jgi:hypothetical protein
VIEKVKTAVCEELSIDDKVTVAVIVGETEAEFVPVTVGEKEALELPVAELSAVFVVLSDTKLDGDDEDDTDKVPVVEAVALELGEMDLELRDVSEEVEETRDDLVKFSETVIAAEVVRLMIDDVEAVNDDVGLIDIMADVEYDGVVDPEMLAVYDGSIDLVADASGDGVESMNDVLGEPDTDDDMLPDGVWVLETLEELLTDAEREFAMVIVNLAVRVGVPEKREVRVDTTEKVAFADNDGDPVRVTTTDPEGTLELVDDGEMDVVTDAVDVVDGVAVEDAVVDADADVLPESSADCDALDELVEDTVVVPV